MQQTTLPSATIDSAINRSELRETAKETSRTQRTSTETCNSTKNQRFFHEKPNKPKNSNLTEQNSRNQ